jgi:hypothetical protein
LPRPEKPVDQKISHVILRTRQPGSAEKTPAAKKRLMESLPPPRVQKKPKGGATKSFTTHDLLFQTGEEVPCRDGTRTPDRDRRPVKDEIQALHMQRHHVPYNGYCGWHCLARMLKLPVHLVIEALRDASKAGSCHREMALFHPGVPPSNLQIPNRFGDAELMTKEWDTINARAMAILDHMKVDQCLEFLPQCNDSGVDMWCGSSDIRVLARALKFSVLLLDEVLLHNCEGEQVIPSKDEVASHVPALNRLLPLDDVRKLKCGSDFEHCMTHEKHHWTYAVRIKDSDTHNMHTRP